MTDAAKRERAFLLYHVEQRKVADVARELNTSAASVIRWARRFETDEPMRAAQLRAGAPVDAPPAGFMAQLRARVEAQTQTVRVVDPLVDDDGTRLPPAPTDADADTPDEDADDLSNESLLELVRGLIREARTTATTSDKREHVMRTIAGMLPVLDRLEKRMRDADDVLHVSKTEVDAAIDDIKANFAAVCDQPFLCAECGRAVRLHAAEQAEAAGKDDDDDED